MCLSIYISIIFVASINRSQSIYHIYMQTHKKLLLQFYVSPTMPNHSTMCVNVNVFNGVVL